MSKYLFLVLLLLGIIAKASAQDMMLNGSFEECDGVAPPGTIDPYNIEYGAYWHNIQGTADLINPCVPDHVSGDPCFGVGCGRFGISPTTGVPEYMYGTTLPLTAGQIYEVSFWVRKDYMTDENKKIGLVMSETVPTASIINATPIISFTPENTLCTKVTGCFTAEHSVTHYVVFGPYGGAVGEGIYIIDSVSVMTIPPTTPLAQASLSASEPLLCFGEQVTLDGTGSANETSYEWKIYNITNGPNLFYSSGIIQGTAGTLTPNLSFPIPGSCYRAELTVYGVCKDVATVEFCIADPDIDFVFDGNPVCENTPVDLQVTGDNGWVYTWKQGNDSLSSGLGLKNLTVTPTMGNGIFTVTVTTPEGCTHTEAIHLNVNTHDNLPPWMDGINGTGEYTYYVSQGDAVFFNSVLSNDHPNEQIDLIPQTNLPLGYATIPPGSYGGIFSLSWPTTLTTSVGEYYYQITAFDNNACGADTSLYKFRIIVVCDQCKVCVGFEDRTPGGTPLPPETRAGRCIQAGFSQPVSTGTADVLFQAGVEILEGPYFEAGPNYEAVIDPTTCLTDCEDCCTDWNGFTFDPLPNPFYINFNDGDPTNDFIQITDTYHPFCAYGAIGFSLEIVNRWGILMNDHEPHNMTASYCCPFESPAPENPIPHATIWWDGHTLDALGDLVQPSDGTYTYIFKLTACNGEIFETSGIIQIGGQNPNALTQSSNGAAPESWLTSEQQLFLAESRIKREELDKTLNVFPNPTTGTVQITGVESDDLFYQIFDDKGVLVSHKKKALNQSFSLTDYSKGTYYIWIYSGTTYVVRKVVKM